MCVVGFQLLPLVCNKSVNQFQGLLELATTNGLHIFYDKVNKHGSDSLVLLSFLGGGVCN